MSPLATRVAADKAAPWVERLARMGFLAKGVLYVTIGALAVSAALGQRGTKSADSHGAITQIYSAPLGRALLALLTIGLAGYAVWRVIEGIHDPEHRGTSAKGIALRLGFVASGLVHALFAYTTACVALRHSTGASEGQQAKDWSARALETPGGVYALWITAAVLVGYGAYQLYCAWTAKLDEALELGHLSGGARRAVIGVSRFGIAARGIVFGAMGVLFARAAIHHAPHESGGIGDSMHGLVQLGRWPFFVIATGVVAYGLYQFIGARYRRIAVR
jgi:hypothetical protein